MNYVLEASLVALGLFVSVLALLELGRRLGARRRARYPERATAGLGALEGAIFALMGLLLAFSFSGALGRRDARRTLIVEEANDIGTAWLRIDQLPADAQPAMRVLFRRYLDARRLVYQAFPDIGAARAELARSGRLQNEIWSHAIEATRDTPPSTRLLVLPALNDMIDVTLERTVAAESHPPQAIYALLFGLVLVSALIAGYALAENQATSWTHVLAFAAVLSITVYVIPDLDYPRFGLIRIDAFDQVLEDVRRSMD
jgi:hypothetical protein